MVHRRSRLVLAYVAVWGLLALPGAPIAGQAARDEPLRPGWCRQLPRPGYASLARVPSADPWFEVYRIRPGVFAIYEPRQWEEVISYVIVGTRQALLFDTGIGVGNMHEVVSRLTSLPVTVLNSHTHFDHVGGNADFPRILNVDVDYARKNAAGATNDYAAWDALAPERLCGPLPAGVTRASYRIRPWRATGTVREGQRLDLGGRELEVLMTPGHTPDSLCLLDRANRLLFTGDTFYLGPIYLYIPETNVRAYSASVARLAALVPTLDLLLPAHNLPVADPKYLTRLDDALRDVAARRVKAVPTDGYLEYRFDGFSLLMSARVK
ncbi:MAG TPA: MBL fold metallo-hydrolase [Vicinamibacterales bacterium]|jgi:glyoxylase-like metal-dependent hydrolase (beta-lactamase superfamily II)